MDDETKNELSSLEREALDQLPREQTPPPLLEQRVVGALKDLDLIRPAGAWWRRPGLPKISVGFAAALALFALGVAAGWWWASAPSREKNLPKFLLVLRAAPEQARARSADEARRRVEEYSAWAGEMRRKRLLVEGEELRKETRVLRVVDGRASTSERRDEPREGDIAGYFLILAQDYAHAITLAESCPYLKYGGSIEVRQIEGS